jgi:threonylcarbamoyladenosine tRNA methylthiotransferase CDKAL1
MVTEIWLTSEDAGTYGRDIGHSFPELCWGVLGVLRPGMMVRIGMTNPPYMMEHMEEMAAILNHPQVYSHMHIPVQSGSDSVLEAMVREYTVADFTLLCDYLLESVKDLTIVTDIICGFPGESDHDFELTLELVRKYKFPCLFISQFYPRPDTVAATLKKLDTKIVKRRSVEMTRLFESYQTNDSLVGTVQKVWLTERESNKKNLQKGARSDVALVGHTKNYIKVLIYDGDFGLLGRCVLARITEAQKWHVVGVVIQPRHMPEAPLSIEHYKQKFRTTAVHFRGKERLAKLRELLAATHGHTASSSPLSKGQESIGLPQARGFPWMALAVAFGVALIFVGLVLTYLGA